MYSPDITHFFLKYVTDLIAEKNSAKYSIKHLKKCVTSCDN